ncbi:MAG: tetratricopeptide repeat protein [bacterium]|nr:tetratricopeptide repeat protein [bacterium]
MRKQMIAAVAVAFIFIAGSFSTALFAQEGRGLGRLKGFVLDSNKNPLTGVKVTIEYKKFNHKLTTTSEEGGKFIFLGLGPGVVQIIAEKEGYVTGGIGLKVSGINKNPIQHIILKKNSEMPKTQEQDQHDALRSQFQKADDLFKDRKFDAALAIYKDFQKNDPKFFKIGLNIAGCYLEMRRYDEAIQEYKDVLKKILEKTPNPKGNNEVAKIYSSIGDTYMRQDKLKEAEEYFKKSIDISPKDHALAYNVAEILFAAGKTDDAVKYYDMAIAINPKWAKSYMQRGYAYLNKGDIKKAIASFNQYLELAPDSQESDGVREVIKSLK